MTTQVNISIPETNKGSVLVEQVYGSGQTELVVQSVIVRSGEPSHQFYVYDGSTLRISEI